MNTAQKTTSERESKVSNENYVVIMGFMLNELNLKGSELMIYAIIYGYSKSENNRFTGSLQYLSDWTNTSKQSVMNCLKSLELKGFIGKFEKTINGVKFCEYHAKKLDGVCKKVGWGMQKSLPNNIEDNIEDKKEINISIVDATASEIDVPVKTAKSSKPSLPAQPEYSSEFEKFWKAYDKPEAGGKKQSYEKWKKLTKETHDLILLYVNWYTKQQPDKQYRKNPITFFNQQPWIDFKPESEKQRTNATNFDTRTLFGELA